MSKVTFGRFTLDEYFGPGGGFIECRLGSLVFADINLRKVDDGWRATFQALGRAFDLELYNGESFMTDASKRELVRSVKNLARADFR